MDEELFRSRLEAAGLHQFVEDLVALNRPAIRLRTEPNSAGSELGGSRLGGSPDLPPDTEWPTWKGRPLSFVAQIALADVSPFDADGLLPSTGVLAFFYDPAQEAWGFEPDHKGGSRVWYFGPDTTLVPRPVPEELSEYERFEARRLRGEATLARVSWESLECARIGMTLDDQHRYFDAFEDLIDENETVHRLLGHPDIIQNDMLLECQLVTNGLYCGDSSGYQDPRAETLRSGAFDWTLLLQVDSDEEAGMMWGDSGRLYYWIRKPDLTAGAWDAAWTILQCY